MSAISIVQYTVGLTRSLVQYRFCYGYTVAVQCLQCFTSWPKHTVDSATIIVCSFLRSPS